MRFPDATNRSRPGQHRLYGSLIARLIWAGLFLIHIVPFITVSSKLVSTPSSKLVLSLAAIVAIMTVALLKALDVRALRFSLNRRKWCTLIVLGLFFHGDIVAKQLPDLMIAEPAMVLLVGIVCSSRKLHHLVVKLVETTSLQIRESLYSFLEQLAPTPLVPVYALLSSPRPPPRR